MKLSVILQHLAATLLLALHSSSFWRHEVQPAWPGAIKFLTEWWIEAHEMRFRSQTIILLSFSFILFRLSLLTMSWLSSARQVVTWWNHPHFRVLVTWLEDNEPAICCQFCFLTYLSVLTINKKLQEQEPTIRMISDEKLHKECCRSFSICSVLLASFEPYIQTLYFGC